MNGINDSPETAIVCSGKGLNWWSPQNPEKPCNTVTKAHYTAGFRCTQQKLLFPYLCCLVSNDVILPLFYDNKESRLNDERCKKLSKDAKQNALKAVLKLKATLHLTISMRGQRAMGKIQRNNYHYDGSCGPSLTGKTLSVSLIFTHGTHRNFKNR